MPRDRGVIDEEQLVLPLTQMLDDWQQDSDVELLLTPDDRRRMFARAGEMRTSIWTVDLDESFRTAAHGTNRLAQSRARPSSFALTAQGTSHRRRSLEHGPASSNARQLSLTFLS